MYILVEIIHTEFQYISLIEMQKYNWIRKRIEKRKTWKKRDLLSRLVLPTGAKGCASHVGAGCTFCPGCQTRDKRAPPFVPDWRSRLGNRDNSGFPTGTNQRFCSSGGVVQRVTLYPLGRQILETSFRSITDCCSLPLNKSITYKWYGTATCPVLLPGFTFVCP